MGPVGLEGALSGSDVSAPEQWKVVYGHRVGDRAGEPEMGTGSPVVMEEQSLEAFLELHRGWHRPSFPEFVRTAGSGKWDGKPVLFVTLDDGYRDALTRALPILERWNTPCMLFITCACIAGGFELAEDRLAHVIGEREAVEVPGAGRSDSAGPAKKKELYLRLQKKLKHMRHTRREAFLRSLAEDNGVDLEGFHSNRFLDWGEVRQLDRHPLVTLGAHGLHHGHLPSLSYAEAWREIAGSKKRLEREVGHEVPYFSYPYGGFDLPCRLMVRLAGFRWAFTTEERALGRKDLGAWSGLALGREQMRCRQEGSRRCASPRQRR